MASLSNIALFCPSFFLRAMQDLGRGLHNSCSMDDDLTFLATSNSPGCQQRLDKHVISYATLQFVTEGGVRLGYDEQWFDLAPCPEGWFFPAYPGPRLRFHALEGWESWHHRHVAFQGARLGQWMASGLWFTQPQPTPPGIDGGALLETLISFVRKGDHWSRLKAINLLESLLLALAEARNSSIQSPWLARVFAALDERFAPDYAIVAQQLGCSVATLRRRFKREMGGQTLHEYVISQRIARARMLLVETDLSLAALAERLGYDSVFFFSRQFKQQAIVTPGEYRRSRLFISPTGTWASPAPR